MASLAPKLMKLLQISSVAESPSLARPLTVKMTRQVFYSTGPLDTSSDDDNAEIDDSFHPQRPEMQLQGVDPQRGWNFRGVHRAIICGKVGEAPVQKILKNGKLLTTFTVGTGGMYDQRIMGANDLPIPAQWHRITVHNPVLGAFAVQKLLKNSSVYVEGDIEIRVYNDGINGEIRRIPEICVRSDGRVRLVGSAGSSSNISFDELRMSSSLNTSTT